MLKSLLRSCCFLILALAPAWSQTKPLRPIAPGVWLRLGAQPIVPGTDLRENTFIIEMKDYLLVVDSGMKATAEAVRADCKELSSKPVKYVFLTHHHFDHVDGNPVWSAAGVTTMAFAGVNEEIAREGRGSEPARKVLSGGSFVLEDATRRVEFLHYGWAHTKGDGFVYLPKEKILITGDTVVNGPYNYMPEADLRNWPGVIRKLETLDVKTVLPGHGEPAEKSLLSGQREFLEVLVAEVRKARQAGTRLEDMAGKLALPGSVGKWANSPFVGTQIKAVHDQLAAGKL